VYGKPIKEVRSEKDLGVVFSNDMKVSITPLQRLLQQSKLHVGHDQQNYQIQASYSCVKLSDRIRITAHLFGIQSILRQGH